MTNGNNQKGKKTNGKMTALNPPQGQGEKSTNPLERTPSSPKKGEFIHNWFIGLPNLEENMEVHKDHQEGNGKKRQEETEEENRKVKEKEILISSGEDTVKYILYPPPEIFYLFKEDQQETSDSDSDLEVTQPATTKNSRRKSNINKRESTTDQEKELGIQKTLEGSLRKEIKLSKKKSTLHKGAASHPSKWRGGGGKNH
jgi:hypothetical protein